MHLDSKRIEGVLLFDTPVQVSIISTEYSYVVISPPLQNTSIPPNPRVHTTPTVHVLCFLGVVKEGRLALLTLNSQRPQIYICNGYLDTIAAMPLIGPFVHLDHGNWQLVWSSLSN